MGCDWYSFTAFCSSGDAIMVKVKDIKEVHRPGSSNTDNDQFDDQLENDDIRWLLDHSTGFKAYNLANSFILFMKENHKGLIWCPSLDVLGPYAIEDRLVRINIEKVSEGEEFDDLFQLARKLTPKDKMLSFAPGHYRFSMTQYVMEVKELQREKEPRVQDGKDENEPRARDGKDENEPDLPFPLDFELICGEEEKKTIRANKTILTCLLPKFESLLKDVKKAQKIELQDLDHDAVQLVLDAFTTYKKVKFPCIKSEYQRVQKVLERFGLAKEDYQTTEKKAKTNVDHPAFNDPRWLDVTFLAGPNMEEVKANRAVLASLNPVLRRILYGTGAIRVDPSKPIAWSEFDAVAVRKVFLALVQRAKKEEVVIPLGSVESAKTLVEYLIESREDLNLYYETPFSREFEGEVCLVVGKDGEGLKLPDCWSVLRF